MTDPITAYETSTEGRTMTDLEHGIFWGLALSSTLWAALALLFVYAPLSLAALLVAAIVLLCSPLAPDQGNLALPNHSSLSDPGASGEGRGEAAPKDSPVEISGRSGELAMVGDDTDLCCHGDCDPNPCPHLRTWICYVDSDDCQNRRVERCFDCYEDLVT